MADLTQHQQPGAQGLATDFATTGASVNVSNAAPPVAGDDFYANTPTTVVWGNRLPRTFNVKHNKHSNLAGDGKEHYYSSINAGSYTLTCTDGSFASSDVGKIIGIENAGTSGSWHITTIATYISATQVTLTAAAVNSVSTTHTVSAEITTFYGTDDTVALQTLINSSFRTSSTEWNGNCEFIFPDALYIIGGALQTAVTGFSSTAINYNSQIYIPNLPYDPASGNLPEFSFRCTMTFKGETRPFFHGPNSIGNAQSVRWGARIRSTLQSSSGSFPSILCAKGGASATDNWAQFNSVGLEIEDLIFELTTNSSNAIHMCAINGDRAKYTRYTRCNAYPHNRIANYIGTGAIATPGTNTIGFIPAGQGDELGNITEKCLAVGFDYGFLSGEHFAIRDCMAWSCISALGLVSTHIPVVIDNLEATGVKYYITYAGPIVTDIWGSSWNKAIINGSINGEISDSTYSAAWFANIAHINDSGNAIHGKLDIMCSEGAVGYSAVRASKIGGENLLVKVIQPFSKMSNHTGTTYTFAYLYEAEQLHTFNNAAAITLTIPAGNTATRAGYCYNFDVGSEIKCIQTGAGQVTIAGAAGVTVNYPTGKTKSAGQYSKFSIHKASTNVWYVSGDLA